jgi:hypothetical protein
MVGAVLALLIADTKRVSQEFWRFKTFDMLKKSVFLKAQIL